MIRKRLTMQSISVLLIAVILTATATPRRAEAFVPLLLANPYVIGALVALAGAGVAVASNPNAAKAVANDFISHIDPSLKNSFMVKAGKTDLMVTGAMWQALKNYISTNLKLYNSSTQIHFLSEGAAWTEMPEVSYATTGNVASPWPIPVKQGTMKGILYTPSDLSVANATTRYYTASNLTQQVFTQQRKYYKNTAPQTYVWYTEVKVVEGSAVKYITEKPYDTGTGYTFETRIDANGTMTFLVDSTVVYQLANKNLVSGGTTYKPYFESLGQWNSAGQTSKINVFNYSDGTVGNIDNVYNFNPAEVTIDDRYADSAWDLSNRDITIPKTADGTKTIDTPEDWVANPATTVPGAVAISAPIAGAVSATDTDYLGTIAGSVTGTAGLTDPQTKTDSLKNVISTKFPFSLPWDLSKLVGAVAATPVRPEIHWNQGINLGGYTLPFQFDIDFSFLDNWIGFFRTFEILAFLGFLISATRRLLGGAQ